MSEVILRHNLHVNNTYASFVRCLADGFSTDWFSRSKDVVISTYEKTVERERKRRRDASENYTPSYPYLTLNPEYEFAPDEQYGRNFYQYPGHMQAFGGMQWGPQIYEDENVNIGPNFTYYKGAFDVICWASSIYDLMDTRNTIFQYFGGEGRIIQPSFEGYFILPDDIVFYEYNNPYTEQTYTLDWDNSIAETMLIRNINKNKMVCPFVINPMIKLVSVTDGSEKYGNPSEDEIGDHRVIFNCEWNMWIPTSIVLVANTLPTPCKFFRLDLGVDFVYSPISEQAGKTITIPLHRFVTSMNTEDSTSLQTAQTTWGKSFMYTLTVEDVKKFAEGKNVDLNLPDTENITDCIYVDLYSRYGKLVEAFQWVLNGSRSIKLIGQNVMKTMWKTGDIISVEIYIKDS